MRHTVDQVFVRDSVWDVWDTLELKFFLPQLDAYSRQMDFQRHISGNLGTKNFAFICNVSFQVLGKNAMS